MEVFEYYDRQNNQWVRDGIEIVSGWNENWVQDKTTDSMNLKLKTTFEPQWKIGDWCRFLHLSGNETGATYTTKTGKRVKKIHKSEIEIVWEQTGEYEISFSLSNETKQKYTILEPIPFKYNTIIFDEPELQQGQLNVPDFLYTGFGGTVEDYEITQDYFWVISKNEEIIIPKNHEQYIIKNIVTTKSTISDEWDCQLALEEPIEITNGISIETRSFTNQESKIVDGVTYNHEAYNHLNVLERILKTTPANNDFEKSWFSRINILNKELLESVNFNDETLSEQTLYSLLMEKYDSSVGRTPVLYFDIDKETDLPKKLEKTTYTLDFLRQDGFDKNEIQFNDLKDKANNIIISQNKENFTDGLISNFDNLSVSNNTSFVSQTLWAIPEVDDYRRELNDLGSSSEVGVWILKLPQKIKKVIKLTKYVFNQKQQAVWWTKSVNEIEVLEKRQYVASNNYNQRTVDWFVEGETIIHLNDFFYTQGTQGGLTEDIEYTLIMYKVEYNPLLSARYDLGKDFNVQVNQNDSQIDDKKFGKYLKEYFASMNKADIVISKTISNFNDIAEIGSRVIDNDKEFLITNISIQNRGFDYDVVYQLNENHFRRNDSIQASQEIRQNIEISIDATKERKSMFVENYKLSTTRFELNNLQAKEEVFSSLFNSNARYPEIALIYVYNENRLSLKPVLAHITRFYLNNTFCLNVKFIDNAEAGKRKVLDTYNASFTYGGTGRVVYTTFEGKPKNQIPVLYTDVFGEFIYFDIKFLKMNNIDIESEDFNDFTTLEEFENYINKAGNQARTAREYPDASISFIQRFPTEISNPIFEVQKINYFKDMLDNFNYTFGFHIETDKNIILCEKFFDNSKILTNENNIVSKIKTYNTNLKESDYALNIPNEESVTTSAYQNSEITFNISNTLSTPKSIVLVDANDNPILIINDFDKVINAENFNSFKLYC